MMKKLLLLAFSLVIGANVFAQSAAELKRDGNIKQNEKNYTEALSFYEKYAAADAATAGEDLGTMYNMGLCAYKTGDLAKTQKYFGTCITKGHKKDKAYNYIGQLQIKNKKYTDALATFEKYYAMDPAAGDKNNSLLYNMGKCSYASKDMHKTIKFFTQTGEAGYQGEKSYMYMAKAYKMLKDQDNYIASLNTGIEKNPNSKMLKKTLAKEHAKESKALLDEGNKLYNQAISNVTAKKYTTKSTEYKSDLSKAKTALTKAIPAADKALELDPTSKSATAIKAAAASSIKNIDTALKA